MVVDVIRDIARQRAGSGKRDEWPLPIDHAGFMRTWMQSLPVPRALFVTPGSRLSLGATALAGRARPSPGMEPSVRLSIARAMKGTVPFFCWGDDCIVPASVGGLVPGTPVMAMAVYRRGRWPAPVMEAIAGLARAYPEIAAGFVRALVTSPRTSQITWNAAIEVLETATGTLAVLPGMKELWSQGLDAIEKETASRKFRARVDVMQPLHAWIRREGVEYKP